MVAEKQAGWMQSRYRFFRSINSLLRTGFVGAFVLIAFSAVASLRISVERARLNELATYTYSVHKQIECTIRALHQTEAMERDVVLHLALPTGNAHQPLLELLPQVHAEINRLRQLSQEDTRLQDRLRRLYPLTEAYQARVTKLLADSCTAPQRVLAEFPRYEKESPAATMLQILQEMNQEEEHLLQQRLDDLNQYAQDSEAVGLCVRLLALAAITLVYSGVTRIAREKDGLVELLGDTTERLQTMATTDYLTGLYNQRAFHKMLEESFQSAQAAEESGTLSLMMLDIDHFKQYNDTYGHPAGDEVLETIGRLLRNGTRRSDFAARNGGEEFAILLPYTGAEEAMKAAEGIRAMIESQPWPLRPITTSIGVATMRPEMASCDALTCAADLALYTSKRNGRNLVNHADSFNDPNAPLLPAEEWESSDNSGAEAGKNPL